MFAVSAQVDSFALKSTTTTTSTQTRYETLALTMSMTLAKIVAIAAVVASASVLPVLAGGEDEGPCTPDCQCVRPELFTIEEEGSVQ